MQQVGPLQVNLPPATSPRRRRRQVTSTVGGPVGVAYSYNSRDRSNAGLKATYYVENGTTAGPQDTEIKLVRTDSLPSFDWGTGTPGESVPGRSDPGPLGGVLRIPTTSLPGRGSSPAAAHPVTR